MRPCPYPEQTLQRVNKDVFGHRNWRGQQLDIVSAALGGEDVFVLMPTGGGKSLCYQLPAVTEAEDGGGVTVVISPLLSLVQDQCAELTQLDIPNAALNSSTGDEESRRAYSELGRGHPSFVLLYVTPEKIRHSQTFMQVLHKTNQTGRLKRFVIDEAHCVSQWGHDFRLDYQALGVLKREFPSVPMMALTATANEKTVADIIQTLGMRVAPANSFRASFNRPNLHYAVRRKG
jgi:bloom syndrome protein